MKYDLSNPLHREQIKTRINLLVGRGQGVVELLECKPQRSMKQNKYLHLLIRYFSSVYGESSDYVKEQYFKLSANRQLFLVERDDELAGHVRFLRSTSSLSRDEMSLAIERFRNWSASVAGIYLPSADESMMIQQAELEVSRNTEYL